MKFEIQRFADTVISSNVANLLVDFYDGDNRTLTIDNPRSDLTASDVRAFETTLKTTQPLIGDKTGASVTGVSKCTIVEKVDVKFDLAN